MLLKYCFRLIVICVFLNQPVLALAANEQKPLIKVAEITAGQMLESYSISADGQWMAMTESSTGTSAYLNIATGVIEDVHANWELIQRERKSRWSEASTTLLFINHREGQEALAIW